MPSLLELLIKGSTPPPEPKEPPRISKTPRVLARAAEALGKALEPLSILMNTPARIVIGIEEALQREPWKSIAKGIAEAARNWPKDQHGRPLDFEEFHYGFAAIAAVEEAAEAPKSTVRFKALDDFLLKDERVNGRRHRLGLGLHPKNDEQLEMWRLTLWELINKELGKPISENDDWLFDSERCRRRLYGELIGEFSLTRHFWENRKIADDPWTAANFYKSTNLYKVRKKKIARLPTSCEFDPERHAASEELTNADLMEALKEFHKKEQERFTLGRLEELLPEQELRVLLLRVENPTWTYQQIADELRISKSTVATYAERTRTRGQDTPEIKELVEGLM